MVRTRLLADGVMEIRLIGDDGQLDAIVEVTRPAYHGLLVDYLARWQRECREIEGSSQHAGSSVLQFPALASDLAEQAPSRQRRVSARQR